MSGFTWLPDAAWRGALLLLIAFVIARLLKPQPAAVRHVLWTGVLAAVVVMPILALIAPMSLPVTVPQRVIDLTSAAPASNVSSGGAEERIELKRESTEQSTLPPSTSLGAATTSALTGGTSWFQGLSIFGWAAVIWMFGVAVLAIRLLAGFVALRRMRTSGRPANDAAEELADACAARLGAHAPPRLIVSSKVAMPCTAGWIKPVILLPDEYSTWSRERLEVVLLHEMSHVRRMDIVPHLISEVARVIYWFNPLVWLAAARLRAEAERATDDRVVHVGAKPSDYAAHLLEIVRQARPTWHPAPLMPLARRKEFEGRLLAILESGGHLASARWALGTVVLTAGLALGVASVQAATAKVQKEELKSKDEHMSVVVPDKNRGQEAPDAMKTRQATPVQGRASDTPSSMLAEALRDPVASVRQAAAEALGSAKDSIAVGR